MGAFVRNDDFRGRIEELFELFPDLTRQPGRKAGSLSGGQRQMLAIARALMLDPVLLLLDEPSAGLSPVMMRTLFDRIRDINQTGVAVLLVEQNAREALRMSDRGYILVLRREPAGRHRERPVGQPGCSPSVPGRMSGALMTILRNTARRISLAWTPGYTTAAHSGAVAGSRVLAFREDGPGGQRSLPGRHHRVGSHRPGRWCLAS